VPRAVPGPAGDSRGLFWRGPFCMPKTFRGEWYLAYLSDIERCASTVKTSA
jgi:hypothetical protein